MTMQAHKPVRRGQQHSAYLSPTDSWTGAHIEQSDRVYYRLVQESSDNLRRALVRYHYKRAGIEFGAQR